MSSAFAAAGRAAGRGLGPLGRALSTKPAKKAPPHAYESFLSGGSSNYVEEMYSAWRANPEAVHRSWQVYFREAEAGGPNPFVPPPTMHGLGAPPAPVQTSMLTAIAQEPLTGHSETMKVVQLVRAFQHRGHNIANLDPLGVYDADLDGSIPPELDLANYGWTDADMEKEFDIGAFMATGFMSSDRPKLKLGKLIERLQQTYAGSIGVEYMHLADREQLNWIRDHLETPEPHQFPKDEKLRILDRLVSRPAQPRHAPSPAPSPQPSSKPSAQPRFETRRSPSQARIGLPLPWTRFHGDPSRATQARACCRAACLLLRAHTRPHRRGAITSRASSRTSSRPSSASASKAASRSSRG